MKLKTDLGNPEQVKDLINNNESSLYDTVNEDGEKVFVYLDKGIGMDVKTYQENGWIRVDSFDNDGFKTDEMFEGRWEK